METIFDHNPTEQEILAHFGRPVSREEHVAIPRDQVTEHALIFSLYRMRGDAVQMEKYRAMLPSDYRQNCLELNDLPAA